MLLVIFYFSFYFIPEPAPLFGFVVLSPGFVPVLGVVIVDGVLLVVPNVFVDACVGSVFEEGPNVFVFYAGGAFMSDPPAFVTGFGATGVVLTAEPFAGSGFGVTIFDPVPALPVVLAGFFSTLGVFNNVVFAGSVLVSLAGLVAVVTGLALGSGFLVVVGFID